MTKLRTLAWPLSMLLLTASVSPLRAAEGEAPPTGLTQPGGAGPDLRDALRRFYVHELGAELGLSSARATALAPRIDALLDAHRTSARDRVAAGIALRRAINAAGDPAAALAALAEAEDAGRAGIVAARAAVLGQLQPREQARFLAFEEPFRARVRELLTGSRAADASAATPAAAASSPRNSASRAERSVDPERTDSVRDTLRLIFVHELRGELGLDDARTLALLGPIDHLLAARRAGDRERRESLDRLRSLAADDGASPEALSVLVKLALEADRSAAASVVAAQRGVLALLSPREGCQFVLLEQRFIGQARRQVRDARALRDRSRSAERPVGRSGPGGGDRR